MFFICFKFQNTFELQKKNLYLKIEKKLKIQLIIQLKVSVENYYLDFRDENITNFNSELQKKCLMHFLKLEPWKKFVDSFRLCVKNIFSILSVDANFRDLFF